MKMNTTRGKEAGEQIDDRDRRALEQYLTVLEDVGDVADRHGEYLVVSESGKEHTVNALLGSCTCKDHEYRQPEGGCKHIRRVRFALGIDEVPADAGVDVDPQLGMHVESVDETDAKADGGRAVATDGGAVTVHQAEDCEVIETDDVFEGPFPEFDRYGNPTGEHFKRCRSCGREVLEDTPESAVSHRDGCRHGEQDDGPQRHEPADFGGGETTGVQDL